MKPSTMRKPPTAFVSSTPLSRVSTFSSAPSSAKCRTTRPETAHVAAPSMRLVSNEKLSVVFASDDGEIANYKLRIALDGDYTKKKRGDSVREMRKKAHFPGFRKGTIPSFILKDIDAFVLRDSMEEKIKEAVEELKLSESDGEENAPKFDFDALVEQFSVGDDFEFDCELVLTDTNKAPVDIESLEPIVDELPPQLEEAFQEIQGDVKKELKIPGAQEQGSESST